MKFLIGLTIAIVCVHCVLATPVTKTKHKLLTRTSSVKYDPDQDWWKNAVFYQIYPRSFKDSDGDGIGDLQGIIEKLEYLKDTGITATWLSPIFLSPKLDQGYDISDYRQVDPDYGTLDDLKELLEKAHELGLKIILDFVPNHTSDQHDWFQLSVNKTPGYEDYYIWKDAAEDGGPPNNWLSVFGHSAWEWNEQRQQYYLHQFIAYQPDLNYRNEKVVEEMKDVVRFWLDFGIDGFRIDAVPFLVEDEEYADEPPSGVEADDYKYETLNHIYTFDQDETFEVIYGWREVLDEFSENQTYPRVMMTEAYSPIETIFRYYGDGNGTLGAHFTFNFNFITELNSDFGVSDIDKCVTDWLLNIPSGYVSNWVLGNHDQHRVATRLGVQNVDAFNLLVSLLPGVQVVYNGEEIGMENGEVTCEQGQDPQATANCTTFDETSRDFERTPFQWDDSENAGFSSGSSTWLPVSEKYKEVNLKAQEGVNTSHYNIFKKGLELKSTLSDVTSDLLYFVDYNYEAMGLIRATDSLEYVYFYNPTEQSVTVAPFTQNEGDFFVIVASGNSARNIGDAMNRNYETLLPHESVIYKHTK